MATNRTMNDFKHSRPMNPTSSCPCCGKIHTLQEPGSEICVRIALADVVNEARRRVITGIVENNSDMFERKLGALLHSKVVHSLGR